MLAFCYRGIILTIQPRSQGFSVRTRRDTRKPWSGPVTCYPKMAVFDSYSSRIGEIFFNEIYKSSKQINSQKTSQSILFMCRAKFGTNQLKSLKIPSMFSKIYRYFWRFSTTAKLHPSCIYRRLHASGDSHEISFLSS